MDLMRALKVMGRHWLIVVIALAATVPVARGVGQQVDPIYEARAVLLVLAPANRVSADGKPDQINPLAVGGPLELRTSGIVLILTKTKRWAERLRAQGATGDYEYRLTSDVLMEVVATDASPGGALRTLDVAIRAFQDEMAGRQERLGAPRTTWATAQVLDVPDEATILLGSRIRATAGVAVLGMAGVVSLAFLAEALGIGGTGRVLRQRRRRRDRAARVAEMERAAPDEGPDAVTVDEDPPRRSPPASRRRRAPAMVPPGDSNGAAGTFDPIEEEPQPAMGKVSRSRRR